MDNEIIIAFESDTSLQEFYEKNNIDKKFAKKIIEEYLNLYLVSKIDVRKFGLDLLKRILKKFEDGKTIRQIAFDEDLLDEDVAKIIHVMLYNKSKSNLKYNFIVLPKKDNFTFITRCNEAEIVLDKNLTEKMNDYKPSYLDSSNDLKDENKLIINMYNNYYAVYKIAEYLNLKVRHVINVISDYYKDSDELKIVKIMPIEYASKLIEDGFTLENIEKEYGVPIQYLKLILNMEKEVEFSYEDYDKSKEKETILELYLSGKYSSKQIAKMLNLKDSNIIYYISKKLNGKYLSDPKSVAAILKFNSSLDKLIEYSNANNVILTDYSVVEGYKLANTITLKK